MLTRDWPGWHIIAVVSSVVIGTFVMITPANLGLSQITVNWVVLIFTLIGGISASLGNSGLPGTKELERMTTGKAMEALPEEAKAAAVATIISLPNVVTTNKTGDPS